MDCAEEATTSVFMLLANACLNLMSLSSKVKKKSQSRSGLHAPVPHFVYHRMLWSELYSHTLYAIVISALCLHIIVSAARSLTCRDDLDSKWQLLLAKNELSRVSLLS